ncbi:hypothetical protein [Kineothrix sp. MB12-C1]|uniref:hypothetical protein n=1 Tax=Kineothrix sp. MB12-C1 TaxID=3070215 RepID=UPI0027D242A6|nr:hypothetical protein [Kineothrix sp. MB12-C1]WMC91235.1 hypothetical protein RBB56_10095 [Kineothrix sp. MB12-C1]
MKKLKKYAIKVDGKYLKEFIENESYCKSGRSIGYALHAESEFDPVFQNEMKVFDSTTCKGYLSCLIECIRWNGADIKNFEVEVIE